MNWKVQQKMCQSRAMEKPVTLCLDHVPPAHGDTSFKLYIPPIQQHVNGLRG